MSHLPEEAAYSQVVGHGMNAQEVGAPPALQQQPRPCAVSDSFPYVVQLARNKRLDRFWIRNLNDEPDGWAAADRTFDAGEYQLLCFPRLLEVACNAVCGHLSNSFNCCSDLHCLCAVPTVS